VSCPKRSMRFSASICAITRAGDDAQACIVLDDGVSTYWKLQDISAGGACITRESAPQRCSMGLPRRQISSISFKIYGSEIECGAAWPGSNAKRQRERRRRAVGVQFDHISFADREGIRLLSWRRTSTTSKQHGPDPRRRLSVHFLCSRPRRTARWKDHDLLDMTAWGAARTIARFPRCHWPSAAHTPRNRLGLGLIASSLTRLKSVSTRPERSR